MTPQYESEKREFVRVKLDVPVRYKFLSRTREESELGKIYEGTTGNISGGGLLLVGKIPNFEWVTELLMEKMVIGVNIILPKRPDPIKALSRVAWIESIEEKSGRCAMGLKFKEITQKDQDEIFKYVIRAQMPSA